MEVEPSLLEWVEMYRAREAFSLLVSGSVYYKSRITDYGLHLRGVLWESVGSATFICG